ncbi:MAG TPA: maleylpyruvate isomerase family mycothiol-dependent enzyme [Streptosporangiaceae bacterium]|nr:maleylpyruvate isomerase family mycothiol-dependent enzyme [Streptosporangiaceae bacterium]
MDSASYLDYLRRDLAAFEACLAGDLSARVEHCGGWTLYDLADHLGRQNLWVTAAVTEQRGDHEAPPAPHDKAALARWFDDTSGVLLAALDTDPSARAWTIAPPPTVGFWQRRRCLETLIHRWDAEHALGGAGQLDPALAADGVAEVIDTMTPRQIRLGRTSALPYAIRLTASDTQSSWVLGPGDPVATVRATAPELLLMLWGRLPADDHAFTWEGDRNKAMATLGGSLVP